MSADNWTYCPQCGENADDRTARLTADLEKLYGKVSPDEYMRRVKLIEQAPEPTPTLREDYDIGIQEGEFSVNFRASCGECGFSYTYERSEKVKLKEQPRAGGEKP